MVDDTLRRLVDAERRGQALVDEARRAAENARQRAHAQAREAEERFPERLARIQACLMEAARSRAEKEIEALERDQEARRQALLEAARAREPEAIEAALAMILDPGSR